MKRLLGVIGLAALLALVVGAVRPSGWRTGSAFDPRSTDGDGSRAAVLLMKAEGFDVTIGAIPAAGEAGTLMVLSDDFNAEEWDAVQRFVDAGGDLVVADSTAPLASPTLKQGVDVEVGGACDIPEFDLVERLSVPVVRTFDGGDRACLDLRGEPWVVERGQGAGRVLSVGTAQPWRNDHLGAADHAAVVVGAARWGSDPVRMVDPWPVGAGDDSLIDLVAPWVWAGLVQLALAGVVYSIWRGTRLGPPIEEQPPSVVDLAAPLRAEVSLTGEELSPDLTAALRRRWETEIRTACRVPDGPLEAVVGRIDIDPALGEALAAASADGDDHAHLVALGRLRNAVLDAGGVELIDQVPDQPVLQTPGRKR